MSQQNVDRVAASYALWQRGDYQQWVATMDPQFEWDISAHPLPDWPDQGKGRAEWLRHLVGYLERSIDYSAEVRELIDAGDDIVVVMHETARMRDTGVILDRDLIQVVTFREGRAVLLRVFKTKAEALEAVGRSD
jgi:ketosteroid isomerase-like protein